LLEEATQIRAGFPFECEGLGLVIADRPNTFSFLDDRKFAGQLSDNPNITTALVRHDLLAEVGSRIRAIPCDDPRHAFYSLQNFIAKETYVKSPSVIDSQAQISPNAYVSPFNVRIGARTVVEPNATVLPDVSIGKDCVIRAGSVIGSEGFEHKRTTKGLLSVVHDGQVIVGDRVELGALNSVAKGFSFRHTTIGDETRTDNLVHIAHGVQIGKRCLVPACAMIAGSVTVGDDVWIGPNASISSHVTLADRSFVTIGAVVTRNVDIDQKVTGNFAIPHDRFLSNLKKTL
jgi:UDP-3-O-[3-hydroxymyristoyl] glucosamine N-acyltransferase